MEVEYYSHAIPPKTPLSVNRRKRVFIGFSFFARAIVASVTWLHMYTSQWLVIKFYLSAGRFDDELSKCKCLQNDKWWKKIAKNVSVHKCGGLVRVYVNGGTCPEPPGIYRNPPEPHGTYPEPTRNPPEPPVNSVTVHQTQTWRQRLRAAFGIKRTKNMTS